MTEPKDPAEQPERPDPFDSPGSATPPPGWTQPGPGQPWEYNQPAGGGQPGGEAPLPPPQGPPPYGQPPQYGQPPYGQPPQHGQPPYGAPQWGQQPQYGAYAGQKPDNYLVWAILSTIACCLPLGVASIVFATQVNSKWNAGDFQGAQKSSEKAKQFAIASAVAGVVVLALFFSLGFASE